MPEHRSSSRQSPPTRPPSTLEWAIFTVGLLLAIVSGVVAYRVVGLYGDGAFASGYHRIRDPETGKSLLVHESRTKDGVIRRVIEGKTLSEVRLASADGTGETRAHVERGKVTRVDRDRDGDGRIDQWEYYDEAGQLVKVGFSLAGDGVLDAWAYRDAAGQLIKIEVSTKRNGKVDRWEYYAGGQMVRVEEDTNGDGRVDRWSTYSDGILISTRVDKNGDGKPDDDGGR